jgi:hypothetical protein
MKGTYTVKAIERDRFRVSKHGIAKDKGGRMVGVSAWDTSTPYYLADEIMREEYPGCDIIVIDNNYQAT